ncbi:unnamed protein product, partial [Meganyctiphanes norvegica]
MIGSTSNKKIILVTLVMGVIIYLYSNVKNEENFKQRIYVIQNNTVNKIRQEEEWMKKIKERFEHRNKLLKEGCEILDKSLSYSSKFTFQNHIYTAPKHKLLVCVVAK